MMRIVTVLIALFVFAAFLVVDAGAILSLVFSWAISGPPYRWVLLCALLAIVALYVCRPKGLRVSGRARARANRSSRQPGARRPQKSKPQARRQKSIATPSKR
jgi:membrane protein implicated in regulation of membrane protease activity